MRELKEIPRDRAFEPSSPSGRGWRMTALAAALLTIPFLGATWLVPGIVLKTLCLVLAVTSGVSAALLWLYQATSNRRELPLHTYDVSSERG